MMPWFPLAPCAIPHCPNPALSSGRCQFHRLTTTARGYGAAHQRERTAALPGARCAACGSATQLERDHIVPRSLGGGDEPANKRWLCRACHHRLGARRDRPGKGGQISGAPGSAMTHALTRRPRTCYHS